MCVALVCQLRTRNRTAAKAPQLVMTCNTRRVHRSNRRGRCAHEGQARGPPLPGAPARTPSFQVRVPAAANQAKCTLFPALGWRSPHHPADRQPDARGHLPGVPGPGHTRGTELHLPGHANTHPISQRSQHAELRQPNSNECSLISCLIRVSRWSHK